MGLKQFELLNLRMKGFSELDLTGVEKSIGTPNVVHYDGGIRRTNRRNPYNEGERGDIRYARREYNKTREEACDCNAGYGGLDFNIF